MTTHARLPDFDNEGLILSSGGAEGAFAVGVVKALAEGKAPWSAGKPVEPSVIVGTSIGAFNAACLVSHQGNFRSAAAALERIWKNELAGDNLGLTNGAFRLRGNPFDYFSPRRFLRSPLSGPSLFLDDCLALAQDWSKRGTELVSSSEALPQRLLKLLSLSAFISAHPFSEVISRNVSFRRLREADTKIAINVTSASSGELRTFDNEDFTDENGKRIIMASAAIPGLLPPVALSDEQWIDGAVLAYTKLAPAINAGARTLHLVHVDPEVAQVAIADPEATVDTLIRMFKVTWVGRVTRGMRDSGRINRQVAFLKKFVRDYRLPSAAAKKLFEGILPPGSFERTDLGERSAEPTRIVVHRYFPQGGAQDVLGMLNFSRGRVNALIEKGYEETLVHDCERNGCILPAELSPTRARPARARQAA